MTRKEKTTMYILAGPNGSGKSTFLDPLIPQNVIRFNADEFAREIAKERGISDNEIQNAVDNSDTIKLAGMRRLAKCMRQSIEEGKSFSTETVLANNSYQSYLEKAKLNGFETKLLYIGLASPKANIIRVSDRVAEGGHGVPAKEIIQRYRESYEHLSDHIKLVDKAEIYDNSSALKSARLILSIDHGEIVEKDKPIPRWVNENINKKLYPDLYKEVLQDSKKEAIQSARKKLGERGFVVSPKPGVEYEGKIISKNEYYGVQKISNDMGILHELDKVPDLRDRDVGENLAIGYDSGSAAKIKENTISNENNIGEESEI